jgi:hypothetical protein
MVLGAKRGVGRVIIDEVWMVADATVVPKLSAAAPVKNSVGFVFIANSGF